jgi:hypothetical protein
MTLENYISCDKGGQVYYNDSQRGIKTHLGWDIEFYDFPIAGEIIWQLIKALLLMVQIMVIWHSLASTRQYCGSGRSDPGCPCFSSFQQIMEKPLSIKL